MKERPILFSGEMVRAILEGRKTQTRRVVKFGWNGTAGELMAQSHFDPAYKCKYGEPVDRLWVKETFAVHKHGRLVKEKMPLFEYTHISSDDFSCSIENGYEIVYRATQTIDPDFPIHWRPSLFMPRWASRITLEIVSVRVERLQDITEEDAKAEGVIHDDCSTVLWKNYTNKMSSYDTARSSYASLWENINGNGAWASNPWVWVIEFKKVEVVK
jgi:hypothetical protein